MKSVQNFAASDPDKVLDFFSVALGCDSRNLSSISLAALYVYLSIRNSFRGSLLFGNTSITRQEFHQNYEHTGDDKGVCPEDEIIREVRAGHVV